MSLIGKTMKLCMGTSLMGWITSLRRHKDLSLTIMRLIVRTASLRLGMGTSLMGWITSLRLHKGLSLTIMRLIVRTASLRLGIGMRPTTTSLIGRTVNMWFHLSICLIGRNTGLTLSIGMIPIRTIGLRLLSVGTNLIGRTVSLRLSMGTSLI